MTPNKTYKHTRTLDTSLYIWDSIDIGDALFVYASITNIWYGVVHETNNFKVMKKDLEYWNEFDNIQ